MKIVHPSCVDEMQVGKHMVMYFRNLEGSNPGENASNLSTVNELVKYMVAEWKAAGVKAGDQQPLDGEDINGDGFAFASSNTHTQDGGYILAQNREANIRDKNPLLSPEIMTKGKLCRDLREIITTLKAHISKTYPENHYTGGQIRARLQQLDRALSTIYLDDTNNAVDAWEQSLAAVETAMRETQESNYALFVTLLDRAWQGNERKTRIEETGQFLDGALQRLNELNIPEYLAKEKEQSAAASSSSSSATNQKRELERPVAAASSAAASSSSSSSSSSLVEKRKSFSLKDFKTPERVLRRSLSKFPSTSFSSMIDLHVNDRAEYDLQAIENLLELVAKQGEESAEQYQALVKLLNEQKIQIELEQQKRAAGNRRPPKGKGRRSNSGSESGSDFEYSLSSSSSSSESESEAEESKVSSAPELRLDKEVVSENKNTAEYSDKKSDFSSTAEDDEESEVDMVSWFNTAFGPTRNSSADNSEDEQEVSDDSDSPLIQGATSQESEVASHEEQNNSNGFCSQLMFGLFVGAAVAGAALLIAGIAVALAVSGGTAALPIGLVIGGAALAITGLFGSFATRPDSQKTASDQLQREQDDEFSASAGLNPYRW